MAESEESPSRWMASRPCWLAAAAVARVAAAMMVFMMKVVVVLYLLQVVSTSESSERICSKSAIIFYVDVRHQLRENLHQEKYFEIGEVV